MNNGLPGLGYISHLQTSQTNIWVTCLSLTHPLHGNPHPAGSVSELELHSFQWLQHSQIQGLPGPVMTASDLGAGAGSCVDSHPGWSPERAPWSCGSTWRGRGAAGSALGTQCTEGLGAGRSEWGTTGVLCSPLATFCSRLRQLQIIWLGQREKCEQHPESQMGQLLRGQDRAWASQWGPGEVSVPPASDQESGPSEGTCWSSVPLAPPWDTTVPERVPGRAERAIVH